jgi:GAF domain-containing protein
MLPEVLALASRTLAADAYSVWQYDEATAIWSVGAHSGLSDGYVAAAMGAIRGNVTTVSLDAPIVAEDIERTTWLTQEHRDAHAAEGTRSMMALPLRYGERVLGTLVF